MCDYFLQERMRDYFHRQFKLGGKEISQTGVGDHRPRRRGPISSSPSRKKRGKAKIKVALYTIGVDSCKALWVSRYKVTTKGPGYVHIPLAPWADEEMAAQLTAEHQIRKYKLGFPIQAWVPIRARNDMFDCAVYSLAALRILHPSLEGLAARLIDPLPPQPQPKPRETWLGSRRKKGDWLR